MAAKNDGHTDNIGSRWGTQPAAQRPPCGNPIMIMESESIEYIRYWLPGLRHSRDMLRECVHLPDVSRSAATH